MSFKKTCLLSSFVLASAVSACSAFEDPAQEPEAEILQYQLEVAHPAVRAMPKVARMTLGELSQTQFIAGHLGTELQLVNRAFEMDNSYLDRTSSVRDTLGTTVERYRQTRNGLDVVGGDLIITKDRNNEILSATGTSWAGTNPDAIDTIADISAEDAIATALANTAEATESSRARLVYLAPNSGGAPVLAWEMRVTGQREGLPLMDDVYIDARTGDFVQRSPQVHTAMNRQTYNANNSDQSGPVVRAEGSGPSGDIDVDAAHDAAGATYSCLQALFQRDSYDGVGGTLNSLAHVYFKYTDANGQEREFVNNAAWLSAEKIMIYANGFAEIDVGTHEMAHAVTSATANLVYQNESGALNESFSDIMAAACDVNSKGVVSDNTWLLGENLAGGAIRKLSDPSIDNYSTDFYADRIQGTADNGGVHGNSGIGNLAFYLMSQGGVHPRNKSTQQVAAMGIFPAAQVTYRALTTYMNANTNFAGARAATEQAAVDLYGPGSTQAVTVSEAWAAVGVGGPAPVRTGNEPDPTVPVVEPTPEPTTPTPGPGNGTPGTGNPGDDSPGTGSNDTTGTADGGQFSSGGCSTGGGSSSLTALLLMLGLFVSGRRRRSSY